MQAQKPILQGTGFPVLHEVSCFFPLGIFRDDPIPVNINAAQAGSLLENLD